MSRSPNLPPGDPSRPPASVAIRHATPADAEALTHLHLDCWDEAYSGLMAPEVLAARRTDVAARVERWRQIVEAGCTQVAAVGGELVGFVSAGPGRGAGPPDIELELFALYTRASVWGTGVGRALLEAAIDDRPAYLNVLEGNDRALRFYQRQGFVADGHVDQESEGPHVRMVRR